MIPGLRATARSKGIERSQVSSANVGLEATHTFCLRRLLPTKCDLVSPRSEEARSANASFFLIALSALGTYAILP